MVRKFLFIFARQFKLLQHHSNNDRSFLLSMYFSDECTFTLMNDPNVQTTRPVFAKNNIWAWVFNNNIIAPFEIQGNLNSEICLDFLVTKVESR